MNRLSVPLILALLVGTATTAMAETKMDVTLGSVQRNLVKVTPDGDGSDFTSHSGVCFYRAGRAVACGYIKDSNPAELAVQLTNGSNQFVAGEKLRIIAVPRFSKPVALGSAPNEATPPAANSAPRAPAPATRSTPPPMASTAPRMLTSDKVEGLPPSQIDRDSNFSQPKAFLHASAAAQYGQTAFFAVTPGFSLNVGPRTQVGVKAFLSFYPDFTALGGLLSVEYFFTRAPDGFFLGGGVGAVQLHGTSAGISESELAILAQAQFGYVQRLTEVLGLRIGVGAFYLTKTRTATLDLKLNPLNIQGEAGLVFFF